LVGSTIVLENDQESGKRTPIELIAPMIRNLPFPVLLVAALLAVAGPPRPTAEGSDLTEFINGLFRQEYQRPPTGAELNYHANLGRNQGPLENYIAVLSSDEYFTGRMRGDYQVYVTRLFQALLGRNPRADELQYWAFQFQQDAGRNRPALVRQFCLANGVTQLPGYFPQQPTLPVPGDARQIANQLVTQVDLFGNLVRNELGYSGFGASVVAQSQRMSTVSQQYRQVVQDRAATQQQLQIAVNNLGRAQQDLENAFYQVPGASPQSQSVLQQISRLVAAARTTQVQLPEQPLLPPSWSPSRGYDLTVAFRDSLRRFAWGLQGYRYQGPPYGRLYGDVQTLLVQTEALEAIMRQNQPRFEIRNAMQNVITQFNGISQDMRRTDFRVQQGWWNLQAQLQTAAQAAGIRGGWQAQPSNPVIINRPAWGQLPYQPTPAVPSSRVQEAIRLADNLVGNIDGCLLTLRPVAMSNPQANQLIGSLQDLKHSALTFRKTAASGAFGNSLSRGADALMAQYRQTAAVATRVINQDPALNTPQFYRLGAITQKIQLTVQGRAS
jgi:hypothetical protein